MPVAFFSRMLFLTFLALLAACSDEQKAADDPARISLQLNWAPEPEFGGYYAARERGDFKGEGLTVEIRPGGPGVPALQMVAAGQVEYGITSADSILVARERGADIVAVFALYQTFPEGIMVHAERGLKTIAEVFAGGTLAMEPGTPYHRMLERRYGLDKVRAVPYSNNLGPFLHDPGFAQQCFITAEPLAARRAGAHPQVFPISDTGYNPYSGVIFTRRQRLAEQPAQVAALVRAVRRGWQAYLEDPAPANRIMRAVNPTMDPDTFAEAAAVQKPLILGERQPTAPLGHMTLERWQTLAEQLRELGLTDPTEQAAAFVNP